MYVCLFIHIKKSGNKVSYVTTCFSAIRYFSPRGNGMPHPSRKLHMMTSSNGNIFRVTGPLCGEFTGPGEFPTQRPVTRSFDVFIDMRLNKRLSKQL